MDKLAKMTISLFEGELTGQEYRTLWGLVEHGDVSGALYGLAKIIRREEKENDISREDC